MTYFDARSGDTSLMTSAGANTWAAPHTMVATLTQYPGSGTYAITFADGSVTRFDASGRLASETDRHGDAVTYAWTGPGMVITAANSGLFDVHEIDVTISGGQVTMATNTQGGLTREVDYTSDGATTGSVTKHLDSAGTTVEITYSYDASSTISTVTVPGFFGGVNASWGFAYTAGWLTNVTYPSSTTRTMSISADPVSDTAAVSYPARVGDLATSDSTVVETFSWDATGRETAHGNPAVSGSSRDGTATTDYAPSGQPRHQVSAAGVITDAVTDNAGDVLTSSDALGDTTTNVYDAYGDLLLTTSPRGAQTAYAYDAAGDMTSKRQQLSGSDWAQTTWDFTGDTHGRVASMTQAIDASHSAVTDYSGYGDLTDPQTTTRKAVSLTSTDTAGTDLVTQDAYDGFGNLTSEIDPVNVTVKTNTYDLSGRLVSETDATGTVTHHRYDVLGNEVETSSTATNGTWANWTAKMVDPTGLVLTEQSYVSSGGMPMISSTTNHTYDGSGNEIKAAASNVGTTTTAYDAQGDVSAQWDPAAQSTTTTSTAQTTVSDADGRALAQASPESTSSGPVPDVTTYVLGTDEVASDTPAGEAATTYGYDADGNQTTVVVPLAGGGTTSTVSAYDLGGRQTSSADASGNVVTTTYDLLGRVTSTALQGTGSGTETTYNSAGWVLSSTDANGVVTTYIYDKDGRVSGQCVGSGAGAQVTHNTYDALGNDIYTLNPDGSSVMSTYDAFGRRHTEVDTSASGQVTHNIADTYDETGRLTASTDTGSSGMVTAESYATSPSAHNVTTSSLGDTTRTVVTDATGLETTASLAVSGSVFSSSVTYRNAAHQPVNWGFTTPAGNGVTCNYWDAAGRLAVALHSGFAGEDRYTYGQDGSLASESHSYPGTSMSYAYTNTGRLASVTATLPGSYFATTTAYAFDATGDITAAGATAFTYNGAKLATSRTGTATTTYSFDTLGRRTAQSSPSASSTYTWAQNADRLLAYTHRTHGSNNVTASFVYDSSGQRTRSVVASAGVITTTTYTYEGMQLFKLAAVCGTQTTTLTYLYNELGQPSAIAAQVSGGPVYYVEVACSVRGDVLFLMDITPNGYLTGDVLGSWDYDAYGNPRGTTSVTGGGTVPLSVVQAIALVQPLRYAGYAYDSFSGLYYCSQRYYDPATCQWISPDPANSDGEQSAYQYCGGDPVGKTDASGALMHHWGVRTFNKYDLRLGVFYTLGSGWTTIDVEAQFKRVSKGYWVHKVHFATAYGAKDVDWENNGKWYWPQTSAPKGFIYSRVTGGWTSVKKASMSNPWTTWSVWQVPSQKRSTVVESKTPHVGDVYIYARVELIDSNGTTEKEDQVVCKFPSDGTFGQPTPQLPAGSDGQDGEE
jgi:RHS repeat-associated protein